MQPKRNLQTILQSFVKSIPALLNNFLAHRVTLLILLVGLLEAIIFAVIIPPWWHYDEPGHFEYTWLVANSPTWPKEGQYNQEMRQEMADSLMKYGWYKIRNLRPDLKSSNPIMIGVPQIGDLPGYYLLASLPLRILRGTNILLQYYAVRAMSLLLYLLTILAARYAICQIFPKGHSLCWMVPTFLALLPAFVDTMTAVNNDVSAVLAVSLFLGACINLMKKGLSIGRMIFLAFTLALCYLTKDTAWFVFLLAPFAIGFAVQHSKFIRIKLGLSLLVFLLALAAMLQRGSPLGWFQNPTSASLPRTSSQASPAGSHAFQIGGPGTTSPGQLIQFISSEDIKALQGKTITFGGWIWANQTTLMEFPIIRFVTNTNDYVSSTPVLLIATDQPVFYHQSISVPTNALNAAIYIQYDFPAGSTNQLFINGLVAAVGEFSGGPPHFTDSSGITGTWDHLPFRNLLWNGSAEQVGYRLRPWLDRIATKLSVRGFNPALILSTLQDWPGAGWYYRESSVTLFRTFWASLAGDKVPVPWRAANVFLVVVTVLGMAGSIIALWHKRKSVRWDIVVFFGMALGIPWIIALTRGASDFGYLNPLYPWARYAYPAILPTALMLCTGWLELLELLKTRSMFTDMARNAVFLSMMFALCGLAALDAVLAFVHGLRDHWSLLVVLFFLEVMALLTILQILRQPDKN